MGNIRYNLNNFSQLGVLVPQQNVAANVPMPQTGGLYIIYNSNTNNRYAGTSSNLHGRFEKRQQVISDLGLSVAQMNQIWAFWGQAEAQDTGSQMWEEIDDDNNYKPGRTIELDNQDINLERLLIRFCYQFFPGFITNDVGGIYHNPTGTNVDVTVIWGNGVNDLRQRTWLANGGW